MGKHTNSLRNYFGFFLPNTKNLFSSLKKKGYQLLSKGADREGSKAAPRAQNFGYEEEVAVRSDWVTPGGSQPCWLGQVSAMGQTWSSGGV